MPNEIHQAGLSTLNRVDGPHGEEVVASLRKKHAALAAYVVEFPFGTVYASLRMDLRAAELCVVAMLAAMGNARPQLEVHIAAALRQGASATEVQQVIHQAAVYAGFPAALNAMKAADAVFDREGLDVEEAAIDDESPDDWQRRGAEHLEALRPGQRAAMDLAFAEIGDRIPAWVEGYAYGRILSRPELDRRTRQLCTVSMLAALGIGEQLRFHVEAARRLAITTAELEDTMYLLVIYAGFPRAINGLAAIRDTEPTAS